MNIENTMKKHCRICSVEIVTSTSLLAPVSRESESLKSKEKKKIRPTHSSFCTAVQRGLTRNQKQKPNKKTQQKWKSNKRRESSHSQTCRLIKQKGAVKERSKKKKPFTQLSLHCCVKRAKKKPPFTQPSLYCCAKRAGQTKNIKKNPQNLEKQSKEGKLTQPGLKPG